MEKYRWRSTYNHTHESRVDVHELRARPKDDNLSCEVVHSIEQALF